MIQKKYAFCDIEKPFSYIKIKKKGQEKHGITRTIV